MIKIYIIKLNTILPEECYPLEGDIVVVNPENNAIWLIGEFSIHRKSDHINVIANVDNCYPEFKHSGNNKTITINATDIPKNYKYKLVAKTSLKLGDEYFNNVQFDGYAIINESISLNLDNDFTKIDCTLNPICKDEKYCDMRVW